MRAESKRSIGTEELESQILGYFASLGPTKLLFQVPTRRQDSYFSVFLPRPRSLERDSLVGKVMKLMALVENPRSV
jgi:hypothetical protein